MTFGLFFFFLEQNLVNIHMVYTKVQICSTACIFIVYYVVDLLYSNELQVLQEG